MLKLALRRVAALIPTLLIIVTVSFAIIRLAPGGPFDEEQGVSPTVRANLERVYGLDDQRSGHDESHRGTEVAHHRQQCRRQGVAPQHAQCAEPPCPGAEYERGSQHLEQTRARQACQVGRHRQRQCQHRQHQIAR